jgi:N-acyl homoserine lactone hydrolase
MSWLLRDHNRRVCAKQLNDSMGDTFVSVGPLPAHFPAVAFNKKHPVKLVDGDYDIFGDGSLLLLSTPGHTPGHQSLLVRLPKTGAIVLSGDVVHFQTSFEHRYVPDNNWSREASLQSMDKIAAILAREHAQLWINHDQSQSDAQKKLPAYYE